MKTSIQIFSVFFLLFIFKSTFAACAPPSCTKVIDNGPDSEKKVLIILGDGYAAADQAKYRQDAKDLITQGVFGRDFYNENQNAFNVYRINLVSTDSGVSQRRYDEKGTPSDASDDTIISTTMKNTALKYIYSGSWAHCWLEGSAQTSTLVQNALSSNVPNYDYVAIILNEDNFGGCGGGGFQIVPRGVNWATMAHEFGHGIGGLRDEYTRANRSYTGGAVNNRNCSTVTNRNSVFWKRFINPATPVPTTFSAASGMDSNKTVGIFQGCSTKDSGIYRPVHNCRMKGNTPEFCPVCYTLMKQALKGNLKHNFNRVISGDFTGDGKTDVVIHNGQDLSLYRKDNNKHQLHWTWTANNKVPSASGGNTWQPAKHDKYYVGDFNNDGKDDLFVFNGLDWNKPYLALLVSDGNGFKGAARYDKKIGNFWTMKSKDQLFVADFNGDGKDDLLIRNGNQWNKPYVGLLRSTGSSLQPVKRYDGSFPGWQMRKDDKLYVADFDGNGKDDVYIFNGRNWGPEYLGMLRSNGSQLNRVKLYSNTLPGWQMKKNDRFYVADFNNDGKEDLYVINSNNWSWSYLLMARSDGNRLIYTKRYDNSSTANNIPGWSMQKGDRFWVADANKDGKKDLFVYNPAKNWSTEYLGTLTSHGNRLSGRWVKDWIGGWNLGKVDKIQVVNYEGGNGMPDIIISNKNWLGMIRKYGNGFKLDRIYQSWIYSPLYDKKPWSNTLP